MYINFLTDLNRSETDITQVTDSVDVSVYEPTRKRFKPSKEEECILRADQKKMLLWQKHIKEQYNLKRH